MPLVLAPRLLAHPALRAVPSHPTGVVALTITITSVLQARAAPSTVGVGLDQTTVAKGVSQHLASVIENILQGIFGKLFGY